MSIKKKIIITIDYETWHPATTKYRIDWQKNLIEPANMLMSLFEKNNMPLTFMFEIAEYLWLKKNDPATAKDIEAQLKDMILRGHDVQLHIHPSWLPELGAKYDFRIHTGFWNDKYNNLNNVPFDLDALFKNYKKEVEKILKSVDKKYTLMAFRAGKYNIQPNYKIFAAMKKNKILIDSSVWAGGYSKKYNFDFRELRSNMPYLASEYDVLQKSVDPHDAIIEFPIYVQDGCKWTLENSSHDQLISFIEKSKDDEKIMVMIGHTKEDIRFSEVEKFIEYLKQHEVQVVQFKEAYISEKEKTMEEYRKYYDTLKIIKKIMNQVYMQLSPERKHSNDNPEKILSCGFAWCAGYASVMKYLCEKENYPCKIITLKTKNHPRGIGPEKTETHTINEVEICGRRTVFDPTTNVCLKYSLKEILEHPKLVDNIVKEHKKDTRWKERGYKDYCNTHFYENVICVNVVEGHLFRRTYMQTKEEYLANKIPMIHKMLFQKIKGIISPAN